MKTVRLVSAFIILALLLALVPASMAQDGMFGLSGEDLAALSAANGASAGAASAAYDFVLTINADAGAQGAFSADLTGSGNYDTTSGVFSLVVGGTVTADGETMPADMEVRVVGETIYIQSPALGPQWLSVSPEEIEAMGEGVSSQLPIDPSALASGDMAGMEGIMEAMNSLATLDPNDYIAATRDGNHFTVNADVAALISSEQFTQFVAAAAQASGDPSMSEMSEAQMAAATAMVGSLLQDSVFQLEQYLTDDALMVSRTVLTSNFTIDPTQIGQTGDPVAFSFVFDINVGGYNESYSVEAPADATPLSEMMGGM